MENKLIMSQEEECNTYNLITENINKLVDICGNTKEAIKLRDNIFELFTTKYSEPLSNILGLQEDLGCPLDVLISALNDGIYANRRKYESVEPIEVFDHFYVTFDGSILFNESEYPYNYDELFKVSPVSNEFYISDYKKTWWLREDKSE